MLPTRTSDFMHWRSAFSFLQKARRSRTNHMITQENEAGWKSDSHLLLLSSNRIFFTIIVTDIFRGYTIPIVNVLLAQYNVIHVSLQKRPNYAWGNN